MINTRTMVMPAIYRFSLVGHPKESEWGWHRAVELVEAINGIRALQAKQPMSPSEINKEYPFAQLSNREKWGGHCTNVVGSDGSFGGTSIGRIDWLETLVSNDMYLPAKIGMALMDAIKHPVVGSLKNMLVDIVE